MNPTVQFIINRLSEKSTWVSLGTFLTGLGVTIAPDKWQIIMGVGMGLGGIAGILLPARVQEQNVAPTAAPTALSNSMQAKS